MTRTEILKHYTVDRRGTIRSPGKFEGEMIYAPYFYAAVMDGDGEPVYDDDYPDLLLYTELDVQDADRKAFPELDPTTKDVLVYESEQGFVHIEED